MVSWLTIFLKYRNLYNKIFGGFLMRKAYELAWANAEVFGKARPRLCAVDDISFRRPVLIGSLLMLSSQVVYVKDNQMLIRVHAKAVDPIKGSEEMTNDFYFKFSVDPKHATLRNVIPQSYSEAMIYIDGQRHF
jgi:acyl-coenzyme A thioesterase 9